VKEFVAVNDSSILFHPASLKREALMFDRIALPLFTNIAEIFGKSRQDAPQVLAEIEWLMDKGITFEPEAKPISEEIITSDEFISLAKAANEYDFELTEMETESAARLISIDEESLKIELTSQAKKLVETQFIIMGLNARYFSVQLRVLEGMDAHPVLSASIPPVKASTVKKSDVIQLGLNALPVPDDTTPWEQIIDYRSDPDSRTKFLALRHWMSEVARAELTPSEVEEKLEYLVNQYQQHMKLHRMKTNVGMLETVITTSAEVLGDLVSFKWGKAAQALFALKRRNVALLEGELKSPGSEVAYIVKAREQF
jgi:hypothetical protein